MSHAHLEAGSVYAACANYLDKRQARIDEKREEMIAKEMGRFSPLRYLLGKPRVTREEAIEKLKDSNGICSPWHLASVKGGFWAGRVEDLRSLAMMAMRSGTGTVAVSDEMADLLQPYFLEAS